jgi:hypothetical protein
MDFILEIPNNLSEEKCEEIIKRFEMDDRKTPGVTLAGSGNERVKNSLDIHISSCDEWKDIDEYLHQQLTIGMREYDSHLTNTGYGNLKRFYAGGKCHDSGYQIQKTTIGEYYSWHDDSHAQTGRFVTYLWYLTSHDPVTHGGGTAFHPMVGDGGKVVKPERGKLLIFPATWTYTHMGLPLVDGDPKYICTGWMHSSLA